MKFTKLFGEDTFPSFSDDVCKIDNSFSYFLGIPTKSALEEEEESNGYYTTPCRAHLNKESICPTILLKTKEFNPTSETFDKLCGVYNASTLYNSNCDDIKSHALIRKYTQMEIMLLTIKKNSIILSIDLIRNTHLNLI